MSVVQYQRALSFPSSVFWQPYEDMVNFERMAMSILVAIMVVRGTLSFGTDIVRFAFWVLSFVGINMRKYKDTGMQTEEYEYPRLPDQVFWKKGSEVYHVRGCHFLGPNVHELYSKRACHQCKNRF